MKKAALLFIAMIGAGASAMALSVVVSRVSAPEVPYETSQIEKVNWPGDGSVTIELVGGESVSYSAAEFARLELRSSTGVVEAQADSRGISIIGREAVGAGALTVCDAAGTIVASGPGRVSLAALPDGVYVIGNGVSTLKILLKTR